MPGQQTYYTVSYIQPIMYVKNKVLTLMFKNPTTRWPKTGTSVFNPSHSVHMDLATAD